MSQNWLEEGLHFLQMLYSYWSVRKVNQVHSANDQMDDFMFVKLSETSKCVDMITVCNEQSKF